MVKFRLNLSHTTRSYSLVWTRKESTIFVVPATRVTSICTTDFPSYGKQFSNFTKALNSAYRIYISSSTKYSTISELLLFFYAIYFAMSSSFWMFLVTSSKRLECPTFVYLSLSKICQPVESMKGKSNWVTGEVNTQSTLLAELEVLSNISLDEFRGLFIDTPFYGSFSNDTDWEQFLKFFKGRVAFYIDVLNRTSEGDCLLQMLANSRLIFGTESSYSPEYFSGSVSGVESSSFSIHRFRNTSISKQIFFTNFSSLGSINTNTQDLFACFLYINSPIFQQDGIKNTSTVPGDCQVSLEGTSGLFIFKKLFSYVVSDFKMTENKNNKQDADGVNKHIPNQRRDYSTQTLKSAYNIGYPKAGKHLNHVTTTCGLTFYSDLPSIPIVISFDKVFVSGNGK